MLSALFAKFSILLCVLIELSDTADQNLSPNDLLQINNTIVW